MFTSAFLRTLMLLGTQNRTLCQMRNTGVKGNIVTKKLLDAYYIIVAVVN